MKLLLEEQLINVLRERGETLCVAESCTGGLVAERLTRVAGASDVFLGGVVAYTDRVKSHILHISPTLIAQFGAVSDRVGREMAHQVRILFKATWSISLTGVAGPSGGTFEKPVGTVFVGLSREEGTSVQKLELFNLSRDTVRQRSATFALEWLLNQL